MKPLVLLALGAYLGYRVGQNAAYEEVGELLELDEDGQAPSFVEVQRAIARMQ